MLKIEDFKKDELLDLVIQAAAWQACTCGKKFFAFYKDKEGTAKLSQGCYDCNMAKFKGGEAKTDKSNSIADDVLDF